VHGLAPGKCQKQPRVQRKYRNHSEAREKQEKDCKAKDKKEDTNEQNY